MDINIIRYIFIVCILIVSIIGMLINCLEHYLPIVITRTYRFGKNGVKIHQALVAKFEVPKRWFKHFYTFAAPASSIIFGLVLYKYLYRGNIPKIIFKLLDVSLSTSRKPLVSADDTFLAIFIFTIQCWKRTYETYYINIFSDQKMHLMHYLAGYIHYLGTVICIIGESEGFISGSSSNFSFNHITFTKLICAYIFLLSSYMQYKCNIILARLRTDKHGTVITKGYKIPIGGLFKYISSPLQFTEILMYIMLSAILWEASTYHFVTMWVIANQVECAFLSQKWYHETFESYPKERKILIPFIW